MAIATLNDGRQVKVGRGRGGRRVVNARARVPMLGRGFGRLTVVGEGVPVLVGKEEIPRRRWKCQCECGLVVEQVSGDSLRKGDVKSCGCLRREVTGTLRARVNASGHVDKRTGERKPGNVRRIDETGNVHGLWTVLEPAAHYNGGMMWRCRCACGVVKEVSGVKLRSKKSMSCGCGRVDALLENGGCWPGKKAGRKAGGRSAGVSEAGGRKDETPKLRNAETPTEAGDRRRAEKATRLRAGIPLEEVLPPRPVAGEMGAAGWLDLLVELRRHGARWAEMEMELAEAEAKGVTRGDVERKMGK